MPQWFEMEKGPFGSKGAKDILWSEGPVGGKGGIVEFGNALKRGGYGTDLNYVPKLCDSYNTVVNGGGGSGDQGGAPLGGRAGGPQE